jgi:hypothetical protein
MYRIANLTRLFRNQEEILEESKLRIPSWVRVPVRLDPVARKLSTRVERRQEHRCLFRPGDYRNHGHNHVYLSRVRVPVKMFPVARKPSRIKQRCQYMYVSGMDYSNEDQNPKKFPVYHSVKVNVFGFRYYMFMIFNDTPKCRINRPMISYEGRMIDLNT